jgi:hypothetical protein
MFEPIKPESLILEETQHGEFLQSKPYDPITGDYLIAGDEVLVCNVCHSVLLKDSLEYLSWKHCSQSDFSLSLPHTGHLTVKKGSKRIRMTGAQKAPGGDIFAAWILDWLFLFFGMVFMNMAGVFVALLFSTLLPGDSAFGITLMGINLFLLIYNLTRDAWFGGRSLGKKTVGLYVVQEDDRPCTLLTALLRTLLSPLNIVAPIFLHFGRPNPLEKLSKTKILKKYRNGRG